jgi:hypothetical protein
MNIEIFKYQTLGTPVPDPDYPNLDCGYDDIHSGYAILPADMADDSVFDPETTRSVELIATVDTIGM